MDSYQYRFINVLGYGWSGSSAIVDMLKEYEGFFEADIEFRLIKDPNGITDLYHAIVEQGNPQNVDIAIREFLMFVRCLYRKKSYIPMVAGLNYKEYFGENFLTLSNDYIEGLVDFMYTSHWWHIDFLKSNSALLKKRVSGLIKRILGKEYFGKMYFSTANHERFIRLTQQYLCRLFESVINDANVESIILDQGVSPMDFELERQFLPNSKIIVVDRDPRDIYADLLSGDGHLIGRDLRTSHEVSKYIEWHIAWRRKINEMRKNKDVLMLQFEDLIFHYDESEKQINDFLNLEERKHISRKEYFNPALSEKNVGIWKDRLTDAEVKQIEEKLSEYIINAK